MGAAEKIQVEPAVICDHCGEKMKVVFIEDNGVTHLRCGNTGCENYMHQKEALACLKK